jgi:hypothetical protein
MRTFLGMLALIAGAFVVDTVMYDGRLSQAATRIMGELSTHF